MRLQQFQGWVQSDVRASRALERARWGTAPRCPRCDATQIYRLGEVGRLRCGACRAGGAYTFTAVTGTWAGRCRVAPPQWLWLVKLFELELTAQRAARELGLSYPTALKAFTLLRRALLAQATPPWLRDEVEADESYFGPRKPRRFRRQARRQGGRGLAHKIPVFGILERHGQVTVAVVPNCSAATLLEETVRKVKRGSLVYTDKWAGYDTLAFCGYRHLRVDHQVRFAQGKVHINGLEGFWAYAKGKLLKHHGVSPGRFPLYLYEMQYRYNHRRTDLFRQFLTASLQLVPDL